MGESGQPLTIRLGGPGIVLVAFALGVCVPLVMGFRETRRVDRRTSVVEVTERCAAAVVSLEVRSKGRIRWSGAASGVVINRRGFVLTNFHVVREASAVRVRMVDGGVRPATVVATSPERDLALLRLDESARPSIASAAGKNSSSDDRLAFDCVEFGVSRSLMPGETVVALGSPYGLQHTVSTGVVSAVQRSVQLPGQRSAASLIQTDAAINPGNSGGALLNLHGELVGINTAIFDQGWGIAFAIPVDRIEETLHAYVYKEHYHGITVDADESVTGMRIVAVANHSPAQMSGLRPGDRVLRCDGRRVSGERDLMLEMLGADHDAPVRVSYTRDGVASECAVAPVSLLWDWLGLRGEAEPLRSGLRVDQVRSGSPASAIDLRPGDVIAHVSIGADTAPKPLDLEVMGEAQLARLLEAHVGERWRVTIVRGGRTYEGLVTPRQ